MEIVSYSLLFFLVALIYSSAGFGGGSSYLALLAQWPYPTAFIRFTGLSCNTLVTAVGSYNFFRKGWLVWKPVLGLLIASVPFCLWSASWKLTNQAYFVTLGICLLLASIAMVIRKQSNVTDLQTPSNPWWLYLVCAGIGMLSGYTGIGGGVYLSPLLHTIRWGSAKHIAATSSSFILANSIAGLIGQYFTQSISFELDQLWLLIAVFAGGFLGSRLSSNVLSQRAVRTITAFIILLAAIRILVKNL